MHAYMFRHQHDSDGGVVFCGWRRGVIDIGTTHDVKVGWPAGMTFHYSSVSDEWYRNSIDKNEIDIGNDRLTKTDWRAQPREEFAELRHTEPRSKPCVGFSLAIDTVDQQSIKSQSKDENNAEPRRDYIHSREPEDLGCSFNQPYLSEHESPGEGGGSEEIEAAVGTIRDEQYVKIHLNPEGRKGCDNRFYRPGHGESVLHIILNAPTTADMVFMTTGGACYFYPQWFEATQRVWYHEIKNWDTGFLGKSCGNLCPTYWHHVEQKDLRAAIDWNLDDSVTNVYHNVDVEWRLNTECHNQKCPHNVNVMGMNIEGVGARNRNDVRYIPPEIRLRTPRFMQIITGLFYGSGCQRPFLVPIPVRDGVERSPTIDDLDVSYWVKQRELYKCTVTRRHLRKTFGSVPGSNVAMEGRYTLYFEKDEPSSPQNNLINRMGGMSGSRETLRGSVVVIKETQNAPNFIVDMTKDDQLMANFLLSRDAEIDRSGKFQIADSDIDCNHAAELEVTPFLRSTGLLREVLRERGRRVRISAISLRSVRRDALARQMHTRLYIEFINPEVFTDSTHETYFGG
ncbi:hypothetical protein BD769DRAFT_1644377 [Suillus cothurnatus]|nr:hypothetical protein BD769DRAFT_1644377 [Suillus cothurnatus]